MPVLHKLHKTRWMHDLRSVVDFKMTEMKVEATGQPAVGLHCGAAAIDRSIDQLSDVKQVASCLDNRLIRECFLIPACLL